MAFTIPQFPLLCNIFDGGTLLVPRLSGVPCNLAMGRRVAAPAIGSIAPDSTEQDFPLFMQLLLPKLTDIRGVLCVTGADNVECPAGSNRYYTAVWVDDAGKGFANEHRVAFINQIGNALGFWPTPIP